MVYNYGTVTILCILNFKHVATSGIPLSVPVPQQQFQLLLPRTGTGTPTGENAMPNTLSYLVYLAHSISIVATHYRSTVQPTDPLHYQGNANWLCTSGSHTSSTKDYGSTIYHSDSSSSTICKYTVDITTSCVISHAASLVPRLSWGREKESLVTTACACTKISVCYPWTI